MACPVSPPQAPCVHQEVFWEWGEVCWQPAVRAGPSQWPLVHGTFLLKQAQIQAALASTPVGRADRKVSPWGGGRASDAAEPVGLMDLEGAGLWGGLGRPAQVSPASPTLSRVCLKTVSMVLSPENMK